MATLVWKPDLPAKWLMQGSREVPVDGRIQFQPDAGPPITRSRFTKEHTIYSVLLIMRDAQKLLLESWYEAGVSAAVPGLGGGVAPFEWSNPDSTGNTYEVKFLARPAYEAIVPGQIPHPDATGVNLDPSGFDIPDPTGSPQRTLRCSFTLIEAAFYVP